MKETKKKLMQHSSVVRQIVIIKLWKQEGYISSKYAGANLMMMSSSYNTMVVFVLKV